MSADYAIPTSWEELLADEKQRRLAADFLSSGGVTGGAEDRAPYAWETDGTRRPGQDAQTAPNFPGVDLVHRSMPTATHDRFQSLAHAVKGIPADTLANFAAGTDANMRRILGEPVAQVAPPAHVSAKPPVAKAAATKTQKSTDPNSPESIRLREAYRAKYPDTPEPFLQAITEANYDTLRKDLEAGANISSREGIAGSTNEREKARTKQQDVHFWAKMQQDAEQFGVSDATRRYIAEQALKAAEAARDEAAATKERDKAEARNVPGFDVAPGATPTPVDAQKMKDTNEAALRMQGNVADLRSIHTKYGETPKGAGAELQQQKLRAIQIEAKNIAGLGALSGPDFNLMQDLSTQDVNSITQWVRRNFAGATLEQSLQGLEEWMNTTIKATAQARGYQPKAPKPQRNTPEKVLPKDAAGNYTLEAPKRSPKDEAAYQWAINNKADPRAAAILKRLGVSP